MSEQFLIWKLEKDTLLYQTLVCYVICFDVTSTHARSMRVWCMPHAVNTVYRQYATVHGNSARFFNTLFN